MELSDLRYFFNVATSGSFSRGASLSHVSPPAISKTIKKLEAEFGTQLFVRTTRQVVLSESGALLLARCRRIFEEIDGFRADLDESDSRVRGAVRIGANEVFSLHLLPVAVSKLFVAHPEVLPSTHEMLPTSIERSLADGTIDVGFTIGGGGSRQVEYRSLGSSAAVLVAGRSHPLYRSRRLKLRELELYPFVVPRFLGLEHLPSMDQFPETRSRKIGATIELLQMAVEMVIAGHHLGYFPEVTVRAQLEDGRLRAIRGLGVETSFELRVLTRKNAPLRPAVRALIAAVEDALA